MSSSKKSDLYAYNFISTVATGTSPYACTSTTLNINLNADMLDGYHSSSFLDAFYGEMYTYEKTVAFVISATNQYHAYHLIAAGDIVTGLVNGWTFDAGRTVDANIVAESNPAGTTLRIETSAAHGLSNNDLVVQVNMNNAGHNGPTKITVVDATHYDCQDIVYVAGAGASAGLVDMPAFLQCSVGSAGIYHLAFSISGYCAAANKTLKFELNNGILALDNIVAEILSTGGLAEVSSSGNVSIAEGDKIWLSCKNETDTSDYTVVHFNMNVHRL